MEFFHKRFDYEDHVDPIPFTQMFDAAIRLISSVNYIITHTGNGALFTILYRGNVKNVYQFNEMGKLNQYENNF